MDDVDGPIADRRSSSDVATLRCDEPIDVVDLGPPALGQVLRDEVRRLPTQNDRWLALAEKGLGGRNQLFDGEIGDDRLELDIERQSNADHLESEGGPRAPAVTVGAELPAPPPAVDPRIFQNRTD